MPNLENRVQGLLLGTAVADSLGLPLEGLTPKRIANLHWAKHLRQRFFFHHGLWSDDTEHSIMLTQALLASGEKPDLFAKKLAWELRWWLVGLPAGVGLATGRSIFKLWLGFPPRKSGVSSAGNGPMMRTAPIALVSDPTMRRKLVKTQTTLTHTDPKAFYAAWAVTELCVLMLHSDQAPPSDQIFSVFRKVTDSKDWHNLITSIEDACDRKATLKELITNLDGSPTRGISGYCYHTLAAITYCGIKNSWSYQNTITDLLIAGGDTDTTAAIAGAICGSLEGTTGIPSTWSRGLVEFPCSTLKLSQLASALIARKPLRVRARWSPLLLLRNLFFLTIVLSHGLLRLLPARLLRLFS